MESTHYSLAIIVVADPFQIRSTKADEIQNVPGCIEQQVEPQSGIDFQGSVLNIHGETITSPFVVQEIF